MNLSLEGKHALVCGASRGIGRSVAIELSRNGASVTVLARSADKLKAVIADMDRTTTQQHHLLVADFTDPATLQHKVSELIAERPVDILINNTGGPKGGPLIDADIAAFGAAMTMHLHCNHVLAQAVTPHMRSQHWGRIVNIISTSVKAPIAGLGVSNTTRGAVASWAKTLAGELGQYGITVNNVLPGFTDTERIEEIIASKADKTGQSTADVRAAMESQVPLGRFAHPDETADAVAFLASPAANYITGVNLPVDGGRTKSL